MLYPTNEIEEVWPLWLQVVVALVALLSCWLAYVAERR